MTSAFSPRCLIRIHRKPQLPSPSLLRGGSFEGWLQSSPAFPGNETSVPYGVNLKERHVDGSWKGKSIWKKDAEWKDRKIHNPFSFLVFWYPPLQNWSCEILCSLSRWQNIYISKLLCFSWVHQTLWLWECLQGTDLKTKVCLQIHPHHQL